jgi:hypothetical protein
MVTNLIECCRGPWNSSLVDGMRSPSSESAENVLLRKADGIDPDHTRPSLLQGGPLSSSLPGALLLSLL